MFNKLGSDYIGSPTKSGKETASLDREIGKSALKNLSEPSTTGLQKIEVDCSKKTAAKFQDLEFYGCYFGAISLKNYSKYWYEVKPTGRTLNLIQPGDDRRLKRFQTPLSVRKIDGMPSRSVSVNCNDELQSVWNIRITPKCTTEGIYVDLESGGIGFESVESVRQNTYVYLPDGKKLFFKPTLGGEKRWVTSGRRNINFKFSTR